MTLRHNIKTRQGDSWTSPTWAVILPGGLGVNLADWVITAQARWHRDDDEQPVISYDQYSSSSQVAVGTASVTLSNGTTVTTSTVQLSHDSFTVLPVFAGFWDCQITKAQNTFTIAEGSYRVIGDVTRL